MNDIQANGGFAVDSNVFLVEDGHPLPVGGYSRYPWRGMEVGQSFFVPKGSRNRIGAAMAGFHKSRRNNGARFTLRTVEGGIRVWRIA